MVLPVHCITLLNGSIFLKPGMIDVLKLVMLLDPCHLMLKTWTLDLLFTHIICCSTVPGIYCHHL